MVFGSFEQGVKLLAFRYDYIKLFFVCKHLYYILTFNVHNINGDKMYYLNYFIIFSIIGYLIETVLKVNIYSGIFMGFFTPIYGIGTIIILLIYKFINKKRLSKLTKYTLLFLLCSISLSLVELIGGILIKLVFKTELWNYTYQKLDIFTYTSVEMALLWGLSSLLFILFIKPIFDLFILKIPKIIIYILLGLFLSFAFISLATRTTIFNFFKH